MMKKNNKSLLSKFKKKKKIRKIFLTILIQMMKVIEKS